MCKRGDIILINSYKDHGQTLPRHSFVVIEDEGGTVCGMNFDLIALVMSSFKNEGQRLRKLSYPGNFPVTSNDKAMLPGANDREGYIKAEQFYYFDKNTIDFSVIGSLTNETFDTLLDFIESLNERGISIDQIVDNLDMRPVDDAQL